MSEGADHPARRDARAMRPTQQARLRRCRSQYTARCISDDAITDVDVSIVHGFDRRRRAPTSIYDNKYVVRTFDRASPSIIVTRRHRCHVMPSPSYISSPPPLHSGAIARRHAAGFLAALTRSAGPSGVKRVYMLSPFHPGRSEHPRTGPPALLCIMESVS